MGVFYYLDLPELRYMGVKNTLELRDMGIDYSDCELV